MSEVRMIVRVIGPAFTGNLRVELEHSGGASTETNVPIVRVPADLRVPNSKFVGVVVHGELLRVEPNGEFWLEIQHKIRAILNAEWDPIGVSDSVQDEYDGYIHDIYLLLTESATTKTIARHLLTLESQMGLSTNRSARLEAVANKLRELQLGKLPDAS